MATKQIKHKIGNNLGIVLFEMAQDSLANGNPAGAFNVYSYSLPDITEDYVISLLKGECVLYTTGDAELSLSDEPDVIKSEKAAGLNFMDWNEWVSIKCDSINETIGYVWKHKAECNKTGYTYIDENIRELELYGEDTSGNKLDDKAIINLCAKAIANKPFDNDLLCNGQEMYDNFVQEASAIQYRMGMFQYERGRMFLYHLIEYVKLVRRLDEEYLGFVVSYEWLVRNGFIERVPKIENMFEKMFYIMKEFGQNAEYHHPMCNKEIKYLKNKVLLDMMYSESGKEYLNDNAIRKHLIDNYDAGYITPDGEFYGSDGPDNAMIHMNLSEDLFIGKFSEEMKKTNVSTTSSSNDPEHWLMRRGWLKVHHNEIYGYFRSNKDPLPEDFLPYVPTEEQIEEICKYADRNWNGKIYTQSQYVHQTEPITTSMLRQADDIALHNMFKRF